jgi:twinkle protein
MNRFEDFGISGVDYTSKTEQRFLCPKCSAGRQGKNRNSKCLDVNVELGIWNCHHCGWSGKLFEKKEKFEPKHIERKFKPADENVFSYFAKRGISKEVVIRNNISLDMRTFDNEELGCICFKYYLDDKLVNIKYRSTNKKFLQETGGAKIFYKINDIIGLNECIITEGEIDALSYEQAELPNAISVPEGGINENVKNLTTKLDFIDNCISYFENINKIYLALDKDGPGLRMQEELARRFGKKRCWIVSFPEGCKDANEVLIKHGASALRKSIEEAELYPIKGVKYALNSLDRLIELNKNGFPHGAKIHFQNFDEHFTWYDSQLTVVTGLPSSGKSNFIDQVMLRLTQYNDWKFGIYSPENATEDIHLIRLCEILYSRPFEKGFNDCLNEQDITEAVDFLNDRVYFIRPDNEEFTLDNILESATGLVQKYGIRGLIIDPWNTIEHQYGTLNETIYTGKVLNRLKYFARDNGLHLILIAHPRKMSKKPGKKVFEVPSLYDISGSANWYNIADNGICVYRHFNEKRISNIVDIHILKVKHKYIGQMGKIGFEFDYKSQSYIEIKKEEMPATEHYLDKEESDDEPF